MDMEYQQVSLMDVGDDDDDDDGGDDSKRVRYRTPRCNRKRKIISGVLTCSVIIVCVVAAIEVGCQHNQTVLFRMGWHGYTVFRLPAVIYHKGIFLAFCEARKGIADENSADIVLRRGAQTGSSVRWNDTQIIAEVTEKGIRFANPVPFIDKQTDTIWLVYMKLPTTTTHTQDISRDHYNQSLLLIKSTDLGETWSKQRDITEETLGKLQPVPGFLALGPGHGIQMQSGRLVIPANFFAKDTNPNHQTYINGVNDHAAIILSDDHGETWRPGGYVPYGEDDNGKAIETSEATVAEISPNHLCLNSRTITKTHPRAQSFSTDGGETFGPPTLIPNLVEPQNTGSTAGCGGSILSFDAKLNRLSSSVINVATNQSWVLFSNPASRHWRYGMSIRLSRDGCQSWSKNWKIWKLASGYSDMTQFQDRNNNESSTFAILYESGCLFMSYRALTFKIFNLQDVLNGIGL